MRKKHCALLVEDDFSELQLLQLAFNDSGLSEIVESCIDRGGEQAINFIEGNRKFDFILLDLNMPRVAGKEVLAHINADFPAPKPVIIILSNSDHPKDIAECRALGADAYLQKPRDFDVLMHFCEVLKKSLLDKGTIDVNFIKLHHPEFIA